MKSKIALNRQSTVRTTVCGLCIAMCTVLPWLFHLIPRAANLFSPMHLPVFLAGLLCGWPCGLACGLAGPFLSSLITGMPDMARLPAMLVECAVYGLTSGLIRKFAKTRSAVLNLYISLIPAMILGRIAAGVARALIFTPGQMTFSLFVSSYFIGTLPAIAAQLVLIPIIIYSLERSVLKEIR